MTRRLLTLFAVVAAVLAAATALAIPSWAATPPVFTPPSDTLVTRMDMPLDFTGASVTSPQGEDLAVYITADHGEVVPNGASTPICGMNPTPGQLCFYTDPAAVGPLNFRGTESQVNNVMNSLKYIPAMGFPQPGNATLNDTMHFSATEQDIPMGLSSGIVDKTVRVEPDNEAPFFKYIPDAITGVQTDVNVDYEFFSNVEVKDPDQYSCDNVTPDLRKATVSAAAGGTLDTDYVGAGFTALGGGTATIVLEGSLVDINNALWATDYSPLPNTSYTDLITVWFDDGGCAGYGGHLTTTGAFPIEVVPGPATHYAVVAAPVAETGTPAPVTVTALDKDGAVANDYAGMVELTSTDGSAVLPPDAPLVAGVGILPVTFASTGNQTVTATDTVDSSITGTSNTIVVSDPPQVDHFEVDAPTNATAGTPFNVTVTAKDSSNVTVTNYGGTVHFSADSIGTIPSDSTLTNGTGTFPFTFTTATNVKVTATDTVDAAITGNDTVTIQPAAADHLDVDAPANAANGTPVNVDVAARDQYGNLAQGYSGTVHLTSSDGNAVLPADNTLVFGFRTFPVTLNTDGNQTVTATDTVTSSITGTSGNIDVSSQPVGPVTHLDVSANTTMTAGGVVDVQVTAKDANNVTVPTYAGTVTIGADDIIATPSADSTLTNGVGNFTVIVRTAGVTNITATDTVTASITGSDSVVVTAGNASHFTVVAPGNATVGQSVNVTVSAYDTYSNLATGYAGTVHFTSTDGTATLPANAMLVGGTAVFPVTFATTGNQTVTATDTVDGNITGTSGTIAVDSVPAGPATHFVVTSIGTSTAGDSVAVDVEARDAADAVATGYSGTVHLTTTDGAATVPADGTLVSGIGTFNVTLRTAGLQTVTATDTVTASITGTTGSIAVGADVTDHLVVSGPGTATNGVAVGITVESFDAFDNATAAYAGTVHLTSTDGSATLAADGTLSNGAAVFSATFNANGSWTVTATDTVDSSITGTTGTITVSDAPPPAATHLSVSGPSDVVIGVPFNVTVTALDASDQPTAGYSGTVHLTSSDGAANLPADAALTNGVGIFSVVLGTAGDQTVTATDTVDSAITGTSAAIAVAAPAVPPKADVDQSSVEAGGTITVHGEGFDPGEQVQIWLHSTPQLVATAVADQLGEVNEVVTIPADTPAGTHHIELIGLASAVSIATADFQVTAAQQQPTTTTTSSTVPATTSTTAVATTTFQSAASTASSTTTSSGTLPVTGAAIGGLVAAGAALVAVGLAALAVARRRRA